MPDFMETGYSRIFSIEGGAGPLNEPAYQGFWMAMGVDWRQGDKRPVRVPSSRKRNEFVTVGAIRGEPGLPELRVQARMDFDLSSVLKQLRKGCATDLQVHFGLCGAPTDYAGGWDKIGILEQADITNYTTDNLSAMEPGQRAVVNENPTFVGDDWYEVGRMLYASVVGSIVNQRVLDIAVCDEVSCGECGLSSDGCQVVFAVQTATAGSPGLPARVIFTQDGFATASFTTDTALPANRNPIALACIGLNLVVISNDDGSITYAPLADIINGSETWTRVATGIVVGGEPNALFTLGPTLTWVVGDTGYIYRTNDPTSGLEVQDSGSATTEDLKAIHGWDSNNLVAVGTNNAVVYTVNGGDSWASVTGPNAGIALNAVCMRTKTEWWVGDATGKLWFTTDSGASWTQKTFPLQGGTNGIKDIVFVSPSVGYMAGTDGTNGQIWRTVNGGFSWYIAPEGSANIPSATSFDALALCGDVNTVFAAGLGAAADGIIIKGEGSYSQGQ